MLNGYIDENDLEKAMPMVRWELENLLNQPVRDGLEQLHVDANVIRRMLSGVVDRFIRDNVTSLVGCIDVRGIVEAMKNKLQTVVNLGAIIGVVNIYI